MKRLFLVCLVAIFALNASAQNALFPTKKGAVTVYSSKDAKGNILGYSQMTDRKSVV